MHTRAALSILVSVLYVFIHHLFFLTNPDHAECAVNVEDDENGVSPLRLVGAAAPSPEQEDDVENVNSFTDVLVNNLQQIKQTKKKERRHGLLGNSFKESYQQFEDSWKNHAKKRRCLMIDFTKKIAHEVSRLEGAGEAKELVEDKIMSLIVKLEKTRQDHGKSITDRLLKLKTMQQSLKTELDRLQTEHHKCQAKAALSMKQIFLEAQREAMQSARRQQAEKMNYVLRTAQMMFL